MAEKCLRAECHVTLEIPAGRSPMAEAKRQGWERYEWWDDFSQRYQVEFFCPAHRSNKRTEGNG